MRRNIEPGFTAGEDSRRKFIAHQLFQDNFLARPAHLQMRRQSGRKLDDAMIEERRPHFHRMSHAHAVGLNQNIVGQKVFLVEPQVRRDRILRRIELFAQLRELLA